MQRLSGLFVFLLLASQLFGAETVLILPFFNLSNSKNIDWVGDSISESVFDVLASEGFLTVKPENRDETLKEMGVRRYARLTRASVMEIAVNLDAAQVLYGGIEFSPAASGSQARGTLTLTAHMLDVRQLKRAGEFRESGPLDELSLIQARLAWRVLRSLRPESPVTQEQFHKDHPPVRVEAIENYIRGLLATAPEQKLKLFTQAARLEPSYSPPCFRLGMMSYTRKEYKPAADWLQRVAPTDPHHREALFFVGLSRYYMSDFSGAVKAFSKLAEAAPLSEVYNNLGAAEIRAGQAAAISSFLKAVENDPADPAYQFNAGYALWRKGEFARAAERFTATLERDPDDEIATMMLGLCRKQVGPRPGDPETDELERVKETYDESAWLHLKAMFAKVPAEK